MIYNFILQWLFINGFFIKRCTCSLSSTDSIEELSVDYEDDRNSMIAVAEKEPKEIYEEFYDELDNRMEVEQSMNMIFFGPPSSFLRLDADSIIHLLTHTKKHMIPISRALLVWDILTDGKTAAFLQGREFLAFGSLLNVIPEEDLYYVNFGDPSVLRYFANHYIKLHPRKFGILAASYRRYYGETWYDNSTFINELGYLLCGFPATDLQNISPATFKELNLDTLNKLGKCNANQTRTLYSIATNRAAYGEPYRWSSHEIGRLSALFTCIPENDISSIQLEAVTAITPEVMHAMHQGKLQYFTKQQILRMNSKTRRIYILRMQLRSSYDMSEIARQNNSPISMKPFVLLFFWSPLSNVMMHYI
ncbi:uncharacterized protein LOC124633290 isoform X1 [Helicoverpa zea]|uniref:uncharacterized protein LOC124633290 isoform X1 n=1 Tax=Helicoverpa zea TaxID=7113 RepID=UPI001F5A7277|nr:uncharacterized protein LOC124633290 isoform X1 [Helicoverpa zea]